MNLKYHGYCCFFLGVPPRALFLKKSAGLLHLIGDKSPLATRESNVIKRTLNQLCYPHTGNGGLNWFLCRSLSASIGFFIQDDTMDVDRPAPQGVHDLVCYFLAPLAGNQEGYMRLLILPVRPALIPDHPT